jgi:hypothetical protein
MNNTPHSSLQYIMVYMSDPAEPPWESIMDTVQTRAGVKAVAGSCLLSSGRMIVNLTFCVSIYSDVATQLISRCCVL